MSATGCVVALILFFSVLVMKLVKFGRKGEDLDDDANSESSKYSKKKNNKYKVERRDIQRRFN